jgi:hypothetical protein
MPNKTIRLATLGWLIASLSACSFFHHPDNTAYQQCSGLKQQMFFINSNLNTNNTTQFQTQQQMQILRNKYNAGGCDQVLAEGKIKAKP